MELYDKVILVGEDNLCETIMAEAILKKLTEKIDLQIISRGLVVLFPEPVNPKAVVVMKENQMEIPKKYSEELLQEDITENTLIIAMKESQVQRIRTKFHTDCVIRTLRELSDLPGDIATPVGEIENYQNTFEHIDLVMKVAAQRLMELAHSEEEQARSEELQDAVEQRVEQIFEETVQTTIGDKIELTEEEKKLREEQLTAEYMEIVEKTQAREAAREAAKTPDVTEIKQLINERKAIIQQEEEAMWGTPGDDDDDDIEEYVD